MLLSANYLTDVGSVNMYDYVDNLVFSQGDSIVIYLQLIDSSVNKAIDGFNPIGRRYMPVTGATLQVNLGNIDDSKNVTRFAAQPFAQDPSIWMFNILSSDPIEPGTIEVKLLLNENGSTKVGKICQQLRVM